MEPREMASRHRARAGAALEIGRFSLAEKEARASLAIEPHNIDGNLYLSRALLGQSRFADAAAAARDAVEIAPYDAYAHYLVGFSLQAAGQAQAALEPLREAVRLQPRGARYHARLAIALLELRDTQGARACIETALSLDSRNPYLLDEAARVHGILGPVDRAEQLAREVITMTPQSASAHWRLAWVLGIGKRFHEASDAARAALAIEPNHWPSWEELGYSLYELGRDDDAEWALREALRLKPGLNSAAVNLANLLWRRGALARAAAVCDEALIVDPSNEKVRRLRDGLRLARERRRAARRARRDMLLIVAIVCGVMAFNARQGPLVPVGIVLCVASLVAWAWIAYRQRNALDDDGEPPADESDA